MIKNNGAHSMNRDGGCHQLLELYPKLFLPDVPPCLSRQKMENIVFKINLLVRLIFYVRLIFPVIAKRNLINLFVLGGCTVYWEIRRWDSPFTYYLSKRQTNLFRKHAMLLLESPVGKYSKRMSMLTIYSVISCR